MKKRYLAVLALTLVLALSACGSAPVDVDMDALRSDIQSADLFDDELVAARDSVITDVVGLDISKCDSAEYYMGSGATGEEYGLFVCKSEGAAKDLVKSLGARRDDLYKTYESYNTQALPRIENAVIEQSGVYVAFIIADNYDAAQSLADAAFSK
ncbi:MAG: DUF4358 domain-containing protein [Oscillospiraceae bacterium]|nr:DUF4358 domain-containing protein [Oscillospiraceae bacterium]